MRRWGEGEVLQLIQVNEDGLRAHPPTTHAPGTGAPNGAKTLKGAQSGLPNSGGSDKRGKDDIGGWNAWQNTLRYFMCARPWQRQLAWPVPSLLFSL